MFENDRLSTENLIKELEISTLGEFNTLNIQCLLPKIDQALMNSPASFGNDDGKSELEMSQICGSGSSEDKRCPISEEVIKALS